MQRQRVDQSSPVVEEELEDLLTTAEVAVVLRCSESTIARRARDGSLGCVRLGGIVRFRRTDVERLVNMDPRTEQARAIRAESMRKARETLVFEPARLAGVGGVVVVVQPGHRLEEDAKAAGFQDDIPTYLLRSFGLADPSLLRPLSESRAAPTQLDLESVIARHELELQELRAAQAARAAAEADVARRAEDQLADLRAEQAATSGAKSARSRPPSSTS